MFSWWGSLYLQDILAKTSMDVSLDGFHLLVVMVQIIIVLLVASTLILSISTPWFYQTRSEWVLLEMVWTVLPAVVLLYLGIPSLELLYHFETLFVKPDLIVKVVGHQWYWEYALPEFDVCFDSFTENNVMFGLANVSESLTLPMLTNIQFLVTSHDVIHSFALPSFALKADAVCGRLNSISMKSLIPGFYVGQCSELCGALHSNMTIVVEFVGMMMFCEWIKSFW